MKAGDTVIVKMGSWFEKENHLGDILSIENDVAYVKVWKEWKSFYPSIIKSELKIIERKVSELVLVVAK